MDESFEETMSRVRLGQVRLKSAQREKRNKEIDQLIENIGDRSVAEKLRIYRMVEEKFLAVERQVETEVRRELLKIQSRKNNPLKILRDVETHLMKGPPKTKVMEEIKLKSFPRFRSDSMQSLPGVIVKYKPPVLDHVTKSKPVSQRIDPDHTVGSQLAPKSSPTASKKPSLTFKRPQRVTAKAKKNSPPNVGLVDYVYDDVDFRYRRWMKLSAHLLQGVDIEPDPRKQPNHLVKTLLDTREQRIFVSTTFQDPDSISDRVHVGPEKSFEKLNSHKPTIQSEVPLQPSLEEEKSSEAVVIESAAPTRLAVEVEVERCLPSPVACNQIGVSDYEAKLSAEPNSYPSEVSQQYSPDFEDVEDVSEKNEPNPHSPQFQPSWGSASDRLSTIPEDSRSQETDEQEQLEFNQPKISTHLKEHSRSQNLGDVVRPKFFQPESSREESLRTQTIPDEIQCSERQQSSSNGQELEKNEDDLDSLMMTKAARSMLEMLDDLSRSESLPPNVSFGELARNLNAPECIRRSTCFEEQARHGPGRPSSTPYGSGGAVPRSSHSSSTNSSTQRTNCSSIPLYSSSTSYTSASNSLDADLSEGPLPAV